MLRGRRTQSGLSTDNGPTPTSSSRYSQFSVESFAWLTDDSPPVAGAVDALFSDASRESQIAELKRNLFVSRYKCATSMVDAAITRGELPTDVDVR
jgi:hypothetical protein